MVYVRISGRAIINIHSANCEGAVGNYISLSKMYLVRRIPSKDGYEYDITEDNVISGNMLKHWHAIETINILSSANYDKICEMCRRKVMYRSTLNLPSEIEYIKRCAIEDLHGFLDTISNVRRESVVKFSFLIPVEEGITKYAAITMNRVAITKEGKIDEEAMMIFKREHASGVYGFSCIMDLYYVGRAISDPSKVINDNERKLRAKVAILALSNILSGRFGASSSRSLPVIRTYEVICAISKKPIPNLTHGYYFDYIEDNATRIKALIHGKYVSANEMKVYVLGNKAFDKFKELGEIVEKCNSIEEIMSKLAEVVEKWL